MRLRHPRARRITLALNSAVTAIAFGSYEKGRIFERLMKAYLEQDPLYQDRFANVWLWSESLRSFSNHPVKSTFPKVRKLVVSGRAGSLRTPPYPKWPVVSPARGCRDSLMPPIGTGPRTRSPSRKRIDSGLLRLCPPASARAGYERPRSALGHTWEGACLRHLDAGEWAPLSPRRWRG